MGTENRTAPPTLSVAARQGDCPKCGHASGEQASTDAVEAFFRRLLRMRPLPAACGHAAYDDDYDMSGLSPMPCSCRHAFHGS